MDSARARMPLPPPNRLLAHTIDGEPAVPLSASDPIREHCTVSGCDAVVIGWTYDSLCREWHDHMKDDHGF